MVVKFTATQKQALKILKPYAPKWVAFIKKVGVQDAVFDSVRPLKNRLDTELSMTRTSCCIVGEAHNFSDEYTLLHNSACKECDTYSDEYCDPDKFATTTFAFVEHLKAKHPEIRGGVA